MKRIQVDLLAGEETSQYMITRAVVHALIDAGLHYPDLRNLTGLKELLEYCRDEHGLVNWQHINQGQPLQQIILYDNDERWAK